MCDYSLHNVRTRPAKVGEKLMTHDFGTGAANPRLPVPKSCVMSFSPTLAGRKTHDTRLRHRHARIRRAGGLFGGCLHTSWYRAGVREASQVSRHAHVSSE